MNAQVRGACPTLLAPMQTGDGLLARLYPRAGTLTPARLRQLAEAASAHGNGMIEVTARGSLQVRGLTAATATAFASAVARIGIAPRTGIAVDTPPLAGLDPAEIADPRPLATQISRLAETEDLSRRLAPKISLVVDGGGLLDLDKLGADLRLTAESRNGSMVWNLSVQRDIAFEHGVGAFAEPEAAAAAMVVLRLIARKGRRARARDLDEAQIVEALLHLQPAPFRHPTHKAAATRPVGCFDLRDGTAVGVALPFGQTAAAKLGELAQAAQEFDAREIRCAPGRALLALGLQGDRADAFRHRAKRFGFIVDADDPGLSIAACAGSPACRSGRLATKALAGRIVREAPGLFDGTFRLHVSGCGKRCAAGSADDATIIGEEDGLLLESGSRDRGEGSKIVADEAAVAVFRRAEARYRAEKRDGETVADFIARTDLESMMDGGGQERK